MKKLLCLLPIGVLLVVFSDLGSRHVQPVLLFRSRRVQPVFVNGKQGAPGATMDGLQLVAKVEKNNFTLGEPIKIIAKIHNVSSHDINVNQSWDPSDDFEITVRDDKGNVPPFTSYGKRFYHNGMNNLNSSGTGPYVIHKGHTRNYQVIVSNIYDFTEGGSYHITLKRRIETRNIIVSQSVDVGIDGANPVTELR